MKPWKTLATSTDDTAGSMTLQERDGVFAIRTAGHVLMTSAVHGSEEALAAHGLAAAPRVAPRVLIGGLGMGYTLRAALDRLPVDSEVVVAEVASAVVEWNRTVLAPLAGAPLEDKRAVVVVDDVAAVATRQRDGFDAILLDVDNGPMALAGTENHHLYSPSGLATFRNALRSGGVLTVWSAGPDGRFRAKLERAGFRVTERPVASRKGSKAKHVLFLGARST